MPIDTTLTGFIPEIQDKFLQLWPHRWDWLHSAHPRPGDKPAWHTEGRYPLSDRAVIDGSRLLGVRFGPATKYLMLDIDAGSPYHPVKADKLAIHRIRAALERLGLVECIAVTSSYSGGLHLYFPFAVELESWVIASAAAHMMALSGVTVEGGTLEIFPNVRTFEDGRPSLFNGHRLPLQPGSYLLNESWELTHTSQSEFVRRWHHASDRNLPELEAIDQAAEKFNRRRLRLSYKAHKFLEDLNREIELGWTGDSQTNWILGRITLRSYIFGHVLHKKHSPLEGDELIGDIVATAQRLPGYRDYCGHQTDIWNRADEWAKCAAACPRYYPYRKGKPTTPAAAVEPDKIGWNALQEQEAVLRLKWCVADAQLRGVLPVGTLERFEYLTLGYGFSGQTLYRHQQYWHPNATALGNTPPHPPNDKEFKSVEGRFGAPTPQMHKSLLGDRGCNPLPQQDSRAFWEGWELETGCNVPPDKEFSDLEDDSGGGDCGKPRPD